MSAEIDTIEKILVGMAGLLPAKRPGQQIHEAITCLKEMVDIENPQPGTIYRVIDNE